MFFEIERKREIEISCDSHFFLLLFQKKNQSNTQTHTGPHCKGKEPHECNSAEESMKKLQETMKRDLKEVEEKIEEIERAREETEEAKKEVKKRKEAVMMKINIVIETLRDQSKNERDN